MRYWWLGLLVLGALLGLNLPTSAYSLPIRFTAGITATPNSSYNSQFSIISPRDGARVTRPTVRVRGIGKPGAEVALQQPIPPYERRSIVDEAGQWQMEVVLTEGRHTLGITHRLSQTVNHGAVSITYQPPWRGPLTVKVMDVGRGESILVQGTDATVLIDGGEQGAGLVEKLRTRNVRRVDLLIATHPHPDHMGGLIDVLQAMPVGQVAYNGSQSNSQMLEAFHTAVGKAKATYREPKRSQVLAAGSLHFKVLNPLRQPLTGVDNNSIVLKLQYGSRSFLFTGDATGEAERSMLASGDDLRADVLKMGHHGQGDASGLAFVQAVAPEIAVYSGGHLDEGQGGQSRADHRLKRMGISVYGTDVHRNVLIVTDGEEFHVFTDDQRP